MRRILVGTLALQFAAGSSTLRAQAPGRPPTPPPSSNGEVRGSLAGDDNVMQLTARNFGARSTWLTFQYTYGQAPKVRETRPEPSTENRPGFP